MSDWKLSFRYQHQSPFWYLTFTKIFIAPAGFESTPLEAVGECYSTQLQYFSIIRRMSDIAYRIKFYSNMMSASALSVRYRRFRYQAQSDIADHEYRTKCPPLLKAFGQIFSRTIYVIIPIFTTSTTFPTIYFFSSSVKKQKNHKKYTTFDRCDFVSNTPRIIWDVVFSCKVFNTLQPCSRVSMAFSTASFWIFHYRGQKQMSHNEQELATWIEHRFIIISTAVKDIKATMYSTRCTLCTIQLRLDPSVWW
jgi:hypothetical protein